MNQATRHLVKRIVRRVLAQRHGYVFAPYQTLFRSADIVISPASVEFLKQYMQRRTNAALLSRIFVQT